MKEDNKWILEPDEDEAKVVRMIFQLYTQGEPGGEPMSLTGLARYLTKLAIPTRGDKRNQPKKQPRGHWSRNTVHRILTREAYIGTWYYGKHNSRTGSIHDRETWIPINVPSLVSREIWEKAKDRLEANKHTYSKPRKNFYLLSGRLTCGKCGLCGVGYTSNNGYRIYQYYRCDGRYDQARISHRCDLPLYRADHVDALVWGWVKALLSDPEALMIGLEAYQSERKAQNQPLRDRLKIVDDLLESNRDQLTKLLDLYLSGEFPKELLTERRTRLEDTIRSLKAEHSNLKEQLNSEIVTEEKIHDIMEFSSQVKEKLTEADNDNQLKRQLLEALDLKVTLALEEDKKVIFIRCVVGESVCTLSPTTNGEPRNAMTAAFSKT